MTSTTWSAVGHRAASLIGRLVAAYADLGTYNRSDDAAPIVIRQDGEARIRLAGAVGIALAAVACWGAAAWVLLRRRSATEAGR